jgi:hypothetical protein
LALPGETVQWLRRLLAPVRVADEAGPTGYRLDCLAVVLDRRLGCAQTRERLSETITAGRYELEHEQHFTVTDSFDDGRECLETVSRWRGTEVPASLASRLHETRATVTVEQDVRLRLLRRLTPTK